MPALRIAQVAPVIESVPPKTYGGTERIVSYLTEALLDAGHDVTLFASGDSTTRGRLVPVCERSARLDVAGADPWARHVLALERVQQQIEEFDVVHYHLDYLHFPLSRRSDVPQLTTLHGRLDLPDLLPLFREFAEMPVVSVSDAQRAPLPFANWVGTVLHGLPGELLEPGDGSGGYLAFLGRMAPEKRPDRAVEIASRAGVPLRLAAKVDAADRAYFEREIEPLLGRPGIEYVGEIAQQEKGAFLGGAKALLFPIDWPEPFGLVVIEAMACGTPVVAFRAGSTPEIVEHGGNGFLVDDVDQAVAAVARLDEIDRRACRAAFDARFRAPRMAEDYLALYERVIASPATFRQKIAVSS